MTKLALLRHGRTTWNSERRLQGRTDIPISHEGRLALEQVRLPAFLASVQWHVSPLSRARETAAMLGGTELRVEPRLVEMSFGTYEGQTLETLRHQDPDMIRNEARGLDFLPPGGESPRQVQDRLKPWLCEIASQGGMHLAITHKAVMRALLALACNWQMTTRQPVKLDWGCLHLFNLDAAGLPTIDRVNIELDRS